ncbi:MAG: CarboxypepD reg-like domain [Acidobacteriota bacterium]|nr:CarboxypepD reg-like domain [Acidobacteriota bacterium]
MKVMKWLVIISLAAGFFQLPLYPKISSRVQGKVIDKDTKQPIQGAKVQLIYLWARTFQRVMDPDQETFTDKDGKFKFDVRSYIKHSAFYLQCEKTGYISLIPSFYFEYRKDEKFREVAGVFRLQEGQIKHFAIELEKGGGLKGTIYKKEASGISPFSYLGGYLKRRTNPDSNLLQDDEYGYYIASINTDKNGNFEITGIEPYDDYSIKFVLTEHPFEVIQHVKIEKNIIENIEYVIDLTDQTGIEGIIKIGQDIAEKGEVWIRNISKSSLDQADICNSDISKDGRYSCKGVNPGTYRVYVIAFNSVKSEKEFIVEIVEGTTKVFNIIL